MNATAIPDEVNFCNRTTCTVNRTDGDLHHHARVNNEDAVHWGHRDKCDSELCERIIREAEGLTAKQADLAAELADMAEWWVKTAKADAEKTLPKALEYGALDFDLMGVFMVGLLGDRLAGADDAEKAKVGHEMAVLFYLIGKMGRAIGAYAQGVLPSDDTLYDTSVYAMMWRRIREEGRWV